MAESEAWGIMTSNEPAHGRAGTDGRAAQTGKEASKKTVGKLAKKVVSWLKKVLWEKPVEYIKLKGKKYLQVAGEKAKQKAKLVKESDVPSKYRSKLSSKLQQWIQDRGGRTQRGGSSRGRTRARGSGNHRSNSGRGSNRAWKCGTSLKDSERSPERPPEQSPDSSSRPDGQSSRKRPEPSAPGPAPSGNSDDDEIPPEVKKELEEAPPEVVAELAAKDQRIRSYVLKNPGLVDASSREEAARRIELMGGAGANDLTAFDTGRSKDVQSLLDDMGPEWGARLGYNEMGGSLPDALNEASGNGDGSTDGDAGEGNSGHTSARTGGDLAGVASGTVDTDAGTTSISTTSGSSGAGNGIGNSGGAGNGVGSGSGSGSGGTGR